MTCPLLDARIGFSLLPVFICLALFLARTCAFPFRLLSFLLLLLCPFLPVVLVSSLSCASCRYPCCIFDLSLSWSSLCTCYVMNPLFAFAIPHPPQHLHWLLNVPLFPGSFSATPSATPPSPCRQIPSSAQALICIGFILKQKAAFPSLACPLSCFHYPLSPAPPPPNPTLGPLFQPFGSLPFPRTQFTLRCMHLLCAFHIMEMYLMS